MIALDVLEKLKPKAFNLVAPDGGRAVRTDHAEVLLEKFIRKLSHFQRSLCRVEPLRCAGPGADDTRDQHMGLAFQLEQMLPALLHCGRLRINTTAQRQYLICPNDQCVGMSPGHISRLGFRKLKRHLPR